MCNCACGNAYVDPDIYRTKVVVDTAKGVVVAYKELDPYELLLTMAKYNLPVTGIKENGKVFNYLLMPKKVFAKAKCAEGDVFDYEKGRKIALDKLDAKLKVMRSKRLAYFNAWYLHTLKEAVRVMDRKGYTCIVGA